MILYTLAAFGFVICLLSTPVVGVYLVCTEMEKKNGGSIVRCLVTFAAMLFAVCLFTYTLGTLPLPR